MAESVKELPKSNAKAKAAARVGQWGTYWSTRDGKLVAVPAVLVERSIGDDAWNLTVIRLGMTAARRGVPVADEPADHVFVANR